jgi:predicted lipid-binding transport protein (Tim44 family)
VLVILVVGTRLFGVFLWSFMGNLPSVLKMGFGVLLSAARSEPRTEGRQRESPPIDPVAAGLQAITDRDPAFTTAPFLEWTRQVSALLVRAWADRDLQPCRPVLTEDCYQFEADHVGRHLGEGWRLSAGSVTAGERQVVAAGADDDGDWITVRIHLTCPGEAARVVRGRHVAEWIEDWRFRRRVVLTPKESGIIVRVLSRGDWKLDRADHVAVRFERAA